MLGLTEKIKVYVSIAVTVLVVTTIAYLYGSLQEEKTERAMEVSKIKLELSTLKLEYADASHNQSERYRLLEKKYGFDLENERKITSANKALYDAAYTRSVLANQRLSGDLTAYLTAHRDRALGAATDSASLARERETADASRMVLAKLFSEARSRSVDLAGYADKSYAAGDGCERSYETVRKTTNGPPLSNP